MIDIQDQGLERRIYTPDRINATLILAHGAGAGNRHDFMDNLAQKLASHAIQVVSFNFPYMQTAYELDKKRPPNRLPALIEHFQQEIEIARGMSKKPIFIAGKSMGGRVATQLMAGPDANLCQGCLVYGYPFIPPGKPEKLEARMSHFSQIKKPLAILQGERDTFGGNELLKTVTLPKSFELSWITSGDHSFKPLKSSGLTSDMNLERAAELSSHFINRCLVQKT